MKRDWRPWAWIALAVLVTYGSVLGHSFLYWDDRQFVVDGEAFNPPTLRHWLGFWAAPYAQRYIPVTYTFWMLAAWLGGGKLEPAIFHGLNLAFHLFCSWLAFSIIRRLLRGLGDGKGLSDGAALLGALVFALHPLQVENVAWMTSFNDILSAFFFLAACRLYLGFLDRRDSRAYGAAFVAYLLALLSRPTAAVLPLVLILTEREVFREPPLATMKRLAPWLVPAAAVAWLTRAEVGTTLAFIPPVAMRIFIAGDALAFYLAKVLFPFQLAPDYGRSAYFATTQAWIFMTWVLPAAIAITLAYFPARKTLRFSALWMFLTLLPVLGFVPFDCQNLTTVADRYMYLPLLGVALAAAWTVAQARSPQARVVIGVVLVFFLGGLASRQTRYWHDTVTLFTHALEVNPKSSVAHIDRGMAYRDQGRFQEASREFEAALRIDPAQVIPLNNLGLMAAMEGRYADAEPYFREAIEKAPDLPESHLNLGRILIRTGHPQEALDEFRKVTVLNPALAAVAHFSAALGLQRLGATELAQKHLDEGARIQKARGG